jgi:chlorite dismutase
MSSNRNKADIMLMRVEAQTETLNRQLINQLQNMLGYLECEFLYLAKDIETHSAETSEDHELPSAKFALAAYCVERASRIVQEKSVIDWLNGRLATMTKGCPSTPV